MTLKKIYFFFFEILIFSRVMPLFRFSPLPTVLISNRCHSIIYRSSLSPAIMWFCFWAWILILLAHCRLTSCMISSWNGSTMFDINILFKRSMLWNVVKCFNVYFLWIKKELQLLTCGNTVWSNNVAPIRIFLQLGSTQKLGYLSYWYNRSIIFNPLLIFFKQKILAALWEPHFV